MSKSISLGLCTLILCSATVFAGTVTTSGEVAGTQLDVIGITGFQTFGSAMGGLQVTANFVQGGAQTCIWAATSATAGGCTSAGLFSIDLDGDTFSNNWNFLNLSGFDSVVSLVLNGTPGSLSTTGTVFDRTFGGAEGTPGSASGADATGTTSGLADGVGEYSNQVAVLGNAPVGDLFTTLTVTFARGLGPAESASFLADTDSIGVIVPEPGSIALMAFGLAGLVAARRKLSRS